MLKPSSDDTPEVCVGYFKFPAAGTKMSRGHCFLVLLQALPVFINRVIRIFAVVATLLVSSLTNGQCEVSGCLPRTEY